MQKAEIMLQKRLIELSKIAYQKNVVTYSDFLNLNELNILHTTPKQELYSTYEVFGGYELSERQMVAFLTDALCYEKKYPIAVMKIEPIYPKYAENLTHRDYLGSILNLGIDRCKVGDILVEDDFAIVFLHESLKQFFLDEVKRIRHTSVKVSCIDQEVFNYRPKTKEIKGTVSSVRLDSLIALAFATSRNKMIPYIEGGRVYVNGKIITSNGYKIKENDIVSVRGLGRFQYIECLTQTKKGRSLVVIELYV